MKGFQSFEEFESRLKSEKIPNTDLNVGNLIEGVSIKKGSRKCFKPAIILASIFIVIFITPVVSNGKFSYSQILKTMQKSFYGEVVEYLPVVYDDGGFQLIQKETSENEKEMTQIFYEVMESEEVRKLIKGIMDELVPGESGTIFVKGSHGRNIDKPIEFNDIESIKAYGLDISFPGYLPEGYKFNKGELRFYSDFDDNEYTAIEEKLENEDILYLWVKSEKSIEGMLRLEYTSSEGIILLSINLTNKPAANQIIVDKNSDYKVEMIELGGKEVMIWNYGNNMADYYIFKMPNREYKTYELYIPKVTAASSEELEKFIGSFR